MIYITTAIFILDIATILTMVFLERKKPSVVVSWSIVMLSLPIVGFLLYVLIGGSLNIKIKRMLKRKAIRSKEFKEQVFEQKKLLESGQIMLSPIEQKYSALIMQNLNNNDSVLTQNNSLEVFSNGQKQFDRMLQDINCATKNINICYYIFATDNTGMILLKKLIEKANQGVEVNLLVDSVGSLKSKRREFKKLVQAGGNFAEFFPSVFGANYLNFQVNYRNHRKIVVIDNKIGYLGGVNIRDDHMSKVERLSPWTDMHIRVEGDSVMELQKIFLRDWRSSYKGADFNDTYINRFFEKSTNQTGTTAMQIISSGPDDDTYEQIKQAMIRLIMSAKRRVVLQSPYFVPDESFMEAIKLAATSGVEVIIMIPKVADHKFVYYCSLSYLRELTNYGVKLYLRKGFMHTKCLLVDDEVSIIGTCNADVRSFSLNFEVSAVIYDKVFNKQIVDIIAFDMENSIQISAAWFKNLPIRIKIAKSFFRLFSAIF